MTVAERFRALIPQIALVEDNLALEDYGDDPASAIAREQCQKTIRILEREGLLKHTEGHEAKLNLNDWQSFEEIDCLACLLVGGSGG